ncbi:hypothetical protein ONZ45_g16203 [Pleurotus djamor]|nr:hypothetical protein ONZ45_g16203 [Pleurotus djamor]
MDPLALTTSIIELGLSIKESIDKFSQRRSHAKELASDVVADLQRIEGFFERNQATLSEDESLGPLRDSLDVLKSDLYRAHKRCQTYEPRKNDTKYKRLVSVVKLWLESDEIEADLVRIKERIQTSMNCLSLLSNGRVEVRVAKMEGILVNMYQGRRRIQQFDSVFTQGLLNGDPGLGAFDPSPSEVDKVGIQYIRLKAMELIDTISTATLITGVTVLSNSSAYTVLPVVRPALHNIIFKTAELQALTSSNDILISELCENTSDLLDMLEALESPDILLGILGAVENRLRQTLRLGTHRLRLPRHIKEEEEGALDFLEKTLSLRDYYAISHACYQSAACSIRDEDLKRASEYIQFSRSRLERRASPSTFHRMKFLNSLMPSIYYHSTRGQAEDCFSYCKEALEVIQPCIASTTLENVNVINSASAIQRQTEVLDLLAFAQVRNSDYTSAYYTGMACMTSLTALSNLDKSQLPDNFDYLPHILEAMQQDMPTWTSLMRNPEHRRSSYIEDYIDDDDTADDSTRPVVWGEAY